MKINLSEGLDNVSAIRPTIISKSLKIQPLLRGRISDFFSGKNL